MDLTATIFSIKRYAIHDGPGIRTTVFFNGCPLNCPWCHNPECHAEPTPDNSHQIRRVGVEELMVELRKDLVFYEESGGGVTLSGGEPLMQAEFAVELLKACKKEGIDTAVDTCGFASQTDFDRVTDRADRVLFDLKLIDESAHQSYTGVSNGVIMANLERLVESGRNVNIRVPLIPGVTDTDENLQAMVDFLRDLPNIELVSLLPYNQFGEDKLKRYNLADRLGHLTPQTDNEIDDIRRRFEAVGMKVKVGG